MRWMWISMYTVNPIGARFEVETRSVSDWDWENH